MHYRHGNAEGTVLWFQLRIDLSTHFMRLAYKGTALNVSKYEVFFGPYFPVFGPDKTRYLDPFHAVKNITRNT